MGLFTDGPVNNIADFHARIARAILQRDGGPQRAEQSHHNPRPDRCLPAGHARDLGRSAGRQGEAGIRHQGAPGLGARGRKSWREVPCHRLAWDAARCRLTG